MNDIIDIHVYVVGHLSLIFGYILRQCEMFDHRQRYQHVSSCYYSMCNLPEDQAKERTLNNLNITSYAN